MAKRGIILVLILVLFSLIVNAQISPDITSVKCGDGILDEYNMCEERVEDSDRCDKLAEVLKIDTACWDDKCVCLPLVNKAFCGNNKREGVEICDGEAEDLCPTYGEMIGMNLTCNKDTCWCDVVGGIPKEYYPGYNETEYVAEGMAVCGDGKLQLNEECDPPNTLCTLADGKVGICAEGCKCVPKESIGIPEEKEEAEEVAEEIEELDEIEPEETEVKEEAKVGFFAKLWNWIKELFS